MAAKLETEIEVRQLPLNSVPDPELLLSDASAADILTSNLVAISEAVNFNILKPYLVQNKCITLVEMREMFKSPANSENVLQLVEIVSKRGVIAFHGFLKSLAQYTSRERGEGALTELLDKLRGDVDKKLSSTPPPRPKLITRPVQGVDGDDSEPDHPTTVIPPVMIDKTEERKRHSSVTAPHINPASGDIPGISLILITFLRCIYRCRNVCSLSSSDHCWNINTSYEYSRVYW